VIWAIVHGEWPEWQIDHINGVRRDTRLCNLRSVSASENSRNCALSTRNKSGSIGVCWDAHHNKWHASIKVDGRQVALGRFSEFENAVSARKAAEAKYGYHVNHGRPSS